MAARHEVDLFTLADDPEDLNHRGVLLKFCREVTIVRLMKTLGRLKTLPYLFTRQPLSIPYFYSRTLQGTVDAALSKRKYDRIFVYCSAMAQYVETVSDIPVIVDMVDVDSDKWIQYASYARFPWSFIYKREGKRLRQYEQATLDRASAVLVSTEREAALMHSAKTPVHVVSNGVDAEYFKRSAHALPYSPPTIVFTGDMAYFPNQQAVEFFARDVLPLIRREVPTTRFLIVGRNPNPQVVALQAIDGVEVTGAVPDVRPYLAQAAVAVAPFVIAAGIQNKILEAMASELPVVATPKAVQGLLPLTMQLIETGGTPEELAAKTSSLLKNQRHARSLGEMGRQSIMTLYSWETALERLLNVIENPSPSQVRTLTVSV